MGKKTVAELACGHPRQPGGLEDLWSPRRLAQLAVLSGRGDEIVDLAKTNLWR